MNSPKYMARQFILKRPTADTRGSLQSGSGRLRLNHGSLDAFYRFLALGTFGFAPILMLLAKGKPSPFAVPCTWIFLPAM